MARITQLDVNGAKRRIDADADRTLLSVLRDDLDLTGTKYGCGEGQCAACTVLMDGQPVKSCLTKVGTVGSRRIVTIEGLARGGRTASGAAGVSGCRSDAVRLVHSGHDPGRGGIARAHSASHRC